MGNDDTTNIKRMPISDFVELGFLQELNRRALHPLGLALEVIVEEDGAMLKFGGIWDYRDDPEGMTFAPSDLPVREGAVERWDELVERHRAERERLFGSVVQPIEWEAGP